MKIQQIHLKNRVKNYTEEGGYLVVIWICKATGGNNVVMARKYISPKVRLAVYAKYNGHCAYCGKEIDLKNMQVDHIDAVYRAEYEGRIVDESIKNYMPACRSCNFYKSTSTLEEFRKKVSTLHERLDKLFIYRLAKQYGMLQEGKMPMFYFEQLNGGIKL